ncbi:MAG: serine hydrolase [Chitinophagales bacterium]|nr:serine hydrolase [Chitinophagales bacterium]
MTAIVLLGFTNYKTIPPFLQNKDTVWADSVLNSMSLDEKIGQLLMVAAYSNKDETHYQDIDRYIRDYKIGGVIFFQGTIAKQAELTNRYQMQSKTPLWIGFDGEWGLGMRLSDGISYPRQLALAAIDDEDLIYDMGAEIARQMKRLGIHINFAPVVDVNINPNNPIINDRAFGENKYNVTLKAKAYVHGMQDNGIMACAKHFPGHGDTETDSHKDLPVLNQSKERLENVELYPFRAMIRNGISSVMVAHMNVLALDNTPNLPSTLSPKIIQDKLIDDMQFKGIVFTDALNMKGITKYYPSGTAEVKAILAGNDVMLFPEDVDQAVKGIKEAVNKGVISQDIINQKVKKILMAKYWLGLNKPYQAINTTSIVQEINTPFAASLNEKLIENTITVAKDEQQLIPIVNVQQKIAHVAFGKGEQNTFGNRLNSYTNISHFYIDKESDKASMNKIIDELKNYTLIIISVDDMSRYASKNFGLTTNEINAINQINKENKKVILALMGTPYALEKFPDFESVVISYHNTDITEDITAQILFGATGAHGVLPVSVGNYKYNSGVCTQGNMRLQYTLPEMAGINSSVLAKIDDIANFAIGSGATPSCQILVARNGKVCYEKSFGHFTYNPQTHSVENSDIYDIASITKITATLPLVMKLYEKDKINLDQPIKNYYPFPEDCNKRYLNAREILLHQAGLAAWIPFYKSTLDSYGFASDEWYCPYYDSLYSIKIKDNLYLRNDFLDSIKQTIYNTSLGSKTYKYSDLGFYLMKDIVEYQLKDSLQNLAKQFLFSPMGMNHTLYNPKWNGVDLNTIVPTEQEQGFRNELIHGTVHDMGAALTNGIGGHAGLFSNTNDLAKYMQMLLNGGIYGGTRYLKTSTINTFTSKQESGNRRGLGFDKPTGTNSGPTCASASSVSFGHSGFTGCLVWADPKYDLIYVFLSNRIYPTAENKKLISYDIRTKIQQVIYDAIQTPF